MHGEIWTDEIDNELRALRAARVPVAEIAQRYGRTEGAVYARCRIIGALVMDRREWDAAETAKLLEMDAAKAPIAEMARALGRTEHSVRWKRDELGLPKRVVRYGAGELDALRAAKGEGLSAVAIAAGTGRSVVSVRAKARAVTGTSRPRWTDAQIAALRASETAEQAVAATGRKLGAVYTKASQIGHVFRSAPPAWTPELDAKLKGAVAVHGLDFEVVAEELGVGVRRVEKRASELGLRGKPRGRPMTDADREAIVAAALAKRSITDFAREIRRDIRTVREVAEAAGVSFSKAPRLKAPRKVVVRTAPAKTAVRPVVEAKAPAVAVAEVAVAKALPVAVARTTKVVPAAKPVPSFARPGRPAAHVLAPRPAKKAAETGREAALALAKASSDAIARFIAERGVTRVTADPIDDTVRALRARGYAVVRSEAGWLVDGRHDLQGVGALVAFARARSIEVQGFQAAAE